ncbi:MAG TPA: hypothetical protein DEA22_05980 [Blastocatellia bacterium]|nr:hypothetical protein [Blastocatellia bacterium]
MLRQVGGTRLAAERSYPTDRQFADLEKINKFGVANSRVSIIIAVFDSVMKGRRVCDSAIGCPASV